MLRASEPERDPSPFRTLLPLSLSSRNKHPPPSSSSKCSIEYDYSEIACISDDPSGSSFKRSRRGSGPPPARSDKDPPARGGLCRTTSTPIPVGSPSHGHSGMQFLRSHRCLGAESSPRQHVVIMPCSPMDEENPLLGAVSGDGPEELRNITLSVSSVRALTADGSLGTTQQVETDHGQVTVAVSGDPSKPAILTYHDLGLNHVTNFQSFFHYPDMRAMLHSFRLVSVNAPGQEEGGAPLPDGYVYPTMEQLAGTVERVRSHLGLRSFIGLGVGMGANVLARYAVLHPMHIDALMLLNCSASAAGWVEWGYQKLNIRHLKAGSITTATVDYLLWHHFGKVDQCSQDLVTVFRKHFEHNLNATNLGLLIDAYIRRTDLGIVRELDPNKKKEARMLRCPVLNITSNYSPHIEDTVSFNGRLDPANSNWMKVQDCGMVLEEQPGKVVEAFRLFLQGQGYVVGSSRRASSVAVSHVEALHRGRFTSNSRQNSLPLIRGVPLRPKTGGLLTTAEESDGVATDQDGAPKEGGKTQDDMAVGVVSSAAANGNDKDIRITENPLEHPAV